MSRSSNGSATARHRDHPSSTLNPPHRCLGEASIPFSMTKSRAPEDGPTRSMPDCPICKDHPMELRGTFRGAAIYVCQQCGASLSVPTGGR